ncbi:MAG: stage III sporulation protein AA [Epulopiscium sp.]|nr:stage III sporulation protein AA [Candidatus Epulonipiscium sp.]
MKSKEVILSFLSTRLKSLFYNLSEEEFEKIHEIRLRVDKPLVILKEGNYYFVRGDGFLTKNLEQAFIVFQKDIIDTIQLMSDYSMYALEQELKNGYITLQGGHRVGITGKVLIEKGVVKTIKYFGAMNIRISHEIMGCAKKVFPYIINGQNIYHTLIISPPACGKTTMLRDLIRLISNGGENRFLGLTVGVVDERSEIGGCYQGVPQNNLGLMTDVLDGCPKAEGMRMLLRSMSPRVIAVDEIGKMDDIFAIEDVMNAGVKLISTVHGSSLLDIQRKPVLKELINKKIFERIVILTNKNGPGTVEDIIDGISLESLMKGRE